MSKAIAELMVYFVIGWAYIGVVFLIAIVCDWLYTVFKRR